MANNIEVKKRVAKADKIIKGAKKGGAIAGAFGTGVFVLVKTNGKEAIKQAPKVAAKAVAVVKNFI